MHNWLSKRYELQRRRSRDYSPKRPCEGSDRPSIRRHYEMTSLSARQRHFHRRYDAYPREIRTRALDDVVDRNPRIHDSSSRLSRQMPDIITSNVIGAFVEKSFGEGSAHTELRTDTEQRRVDFDQLFCSDSRHRYDR